MSLVRDAHGSIAAALPLEPARRRQLRIRRLLTLPFPFAAVYALLIMAGVPEGPGLVLGGIAGACLAGVIVLARSARELSAALAGFGFGTALGALLDLESCTRCGYLIGPVVGLLLTSTITGKDRGRRQPQTLARAAANLKGTIE